MVKLREKTDIKTIVYTSIGDYLPFVKRLLFPLVAKKKDWPPMFRRLRICMLSKTLYPDTARIPPRRM